MSRWLRTVFSVGAVSGGTSGEDADAAIARGMADVLAALDQMIDDDAALHQVYAGQSERTKPVDTQARLPGTASPRRRRVPLRPAARLPVRPAVGIAAALAAGAVALAITELPGAGPSGTRAHGPTIDTAYVLKKVDSALNAAEPGEIAQMAITSRPSPAAGGTNGRALSAVTAEEWSYGDQWRVLVMGTSGKPALDVGHSSSAGLTEVNYAQRAWARSRELGSQGPPPGLQSSPGPVRRLSATPAPVPASGASGCEQAFADLSWLLHPGLVGAKAAPQPGTVDSTLRDAISCGALKVTGRQRVNGIEAIELTSSLGSAFDETVWVNPATYLPTRININSVPGTPVQKQTADITWLPATAQNLAKLTVPIPAGFRRVPPADISSTLIIGPPSP